MRYIDSSGENGVSLSGIVAIVGHVNGAANDHDIATFSGLVLTLTSEATSNGNSITRYTIWVI